MHQYKMILHAVHSYLEQWLVYGGGTIFLYGGSPSKLLKNVLLIKGQSLNNLLFLRYMTFDVFFKISCPLSAP